MRNPHYFKKKKVKTSFTYKYMSTYDIELYQTYFL